MTSVYKCVRCREIYHYNWKRCLRCGAALQEVFE